MEPMENIKLVLTQNIKSRRKQLKINQDELAERSGLSLGYIKNIERGVSWPSPESFEAISKGLEISIGDLLEDVSSGKTAVYVAPVSEMVKRLVCVPDDIYDLAMKVKLDDSAWDTVRSALEIAIERPVKQSKHSSQA